MMITEWTVWLEPLRGLKTAPLAAQRLKIGAVEVILIVAAEHSAQTDVVDLDFAPLERCLPSPARAHGEAAVVTNLRRCLRLSGHDVGGRP